MAFQKTLLAGITTGKGDIDTTSLFVAEQSLLKLATYNDCTNGILYAMPFLFEEGDELYLYVRWEHILKYFYFHVKNVYTGMFLGGFR